MAMTLDSKQNLEDKQAFASFSLARFFFSVPVVSSVTLTPAGAPVCMPTK